jgi:hypothetical protein
MLKKEHFIAVCVLKQSPRKIFKDLWHYFVVSHKSLSLIRIIIEGERQRWFKFLFYQRCIYALKKILQRLYWASINNHLNNRHAKHSLGTTISLNLKVFSHSNWDYLNAQEWNFYCIKQILIAKKKETFISKIRGTLVKS